MTELIKEIADEKQTEKKENLSRKYFDTFLSQMEDVTVTDLKDYIDNALLIEDDVGQSILLYQNFKEYGASVLFIETKYSDGFYQQIKEKYDSESEKWLVVK